jgi:hypothetical protein
MRTTLLLSLLFAGACGTNDGDSSLYLTGSEEGYVTAANGAKTCMGHKELICHIPPGNPANAHTICVGHPAVEPHVTLHHDTLGACVTEPTPPPQDPPPPEQPPGGGSGSGTPTPDPGTPIQ